MPTGVAGVVVGRASRSRGRESRRSSMGRVGRGFSGVRVGWVVSERGVSLRGLEVGRSRRVSLGVVPMRVGGGKLAGGVLTGVTVAGLIIGVGVVEERGVGLSLLRRGRGWGSDMWVLPGERSGVPRMGLG